MSNAYRDKLRTVGYLPNGRTRTVVKDHRSNDDGHRIKESIDENGGSTFEHANSDRVDVNIRPKVVDIDLQLTGQE